MRSENNCFFKLNSRTGVHKMYMEKSVMDMHASLCVDESSSSSHGIVFNSIFYIFSFRLRELLYARKCVCVAAMERATVFNLSKRHR